MTATDDLPDRVRNWNVDDVLAGTVDLIADLWAEVERLQGLLQSQQADGRIREKVWVVTSQAEQRVSEQRRAEVERLQADVAAASAEIANLTAERERLLDAAAARGIYPTEGL